MSTLMVENECMNAHAVSWRGWRFGQPANPLAYICFSWVGLVNVATPMLITMKYRRFWKTTESSKFIDLWATYISGFSSHWFIYKHIFITFVNNQLDAQYFSMYVYFYSPHVSGSHVPIIRRINCINTSGICHSV